jgi:hypothetical protein
LLAWVSPVSKIGAVHHRIFAGASGKTAQKCEPATAEFGMGKDENGRLAPPVLLTD